jgi:redox-sensitive bicupin YhaK (pirin superfamily)
MHAVLEASPAVRQLRHRTRGHRKAWFTRLMSPSGLGEMAKPFVFLDDFDIAPSGAPTAGMHPHSGIATVTVVRSGAMDYIDTTGAQGTLATGGVEWMRAGGGVWHGGGAAPGAPVRGFQLWLALPPEQENGPADSQYLAPELVPAAGPARVVLGNYQGVASPIRTGTAINYLHVKLADGEQWRYTPPAGHDVAWVALAPGGQLHTADTVLEREIALFDHSSLAIDFTAQGDTEFVLGSAPQHPHPLVLGYYSVHTSDDALQRGEAQIEQIRQQLKL